MRAINNVSNRSGILHFPSRRISTLEDLVADGMSRSTGSPQHLLIYNTRYHPLSIENTWDCGLQSLDIGHIGDSRNGRDYSTT